MKLGEEFNWGEFMIEVTKNFKELLKASRIFEESYET
jgi:hypothetical protein